MKDKDAAELVARTRRIETRLTQFMIAQGVATEHQKPEFVRGSPADGRAANRVILPSKHTPLTEIMAVVPDNSGPFDVLVGDTWLARMALAN